MNKAICPVCNAPELISDELSGTPLGAAVVVWHCTRCGFELRMPPSAGVEQVRVAESCDSYCANCCLTFDSETELGEISDIFQYMETGDVMPAGLCPKCGNPVHLKRSRLFLRPV